MLVLTRKATERILIGESIEITVVSISSRTVRIGINAPKDTSILREELKPHQIQISTAASGPVAR